MTRNVTVPVACFALVLCWSLGGHAGSRRAGAGKYELRITSYRVSARKLSGRPWDTDGSHPDVRFDLRGEGAANLRRLTGGVHGDRLRGRGGDGWQFDWDGRGRLVLSAYDKDLMADDPIGGASIARSGLLADGAVVLDGGRGTIHVTLEWRQILGPVGRRHAPPPVGALGAYGGGWSRDGQSFAFCSGNECAGGAASTGRKPRLYGKLPSGQRKRLALRPTEAATQPLRLRGLTFDATESEEEGGWQITVSSSKGPSAVVVRGDEWFGFGHMGTELYLSPDGTKLGFGADVSDERDDGPTVLLAGSFDVLKSSAYALNREGLHRHQAGRYREAVAYYSVALELDPTYRVSRYNRSCAYALLGDTERSLRDAATLVSADPKKYRKKMATDPDFDPIRSDSRFRAMVR